MHDDITTKAIELRVKFAFVNLMCHICTALHKIIALYDFVDTHVETRVIPHFEQVPCTQI